MVDLVRGQAGRDHMGVGISGNSGDGRVGGGGGGAGVVAVLSTDVPRALTGVGCVPVLWDGVVIAGGGGGRGGGGS